MPIVLVGCGEAPETSEIYQRVMQGKAPVGQVLTVSDPPVRLWFARTTDEDGDLRLCGPRSCGHDVSDRPEPAWAEDREGDLYYGAARPGVAGVRARTVEGATVSGTVHRPAGAPLSIWTVTVPGARVRGFDFLDSSGQPVATTGVSGT
ncbi:hypothetical protein [Nonomuraea sp. NPDC003804]|uniref:hypothetical protein n=1 Tax=Nonomuraea sp. NPDC003804 TaxID=3154547 RepID=UPI0033AA76AB